MAARSLREGEVLPMPNYLGTTAANEGGRSISGKSLATRPRPARTREALQQQNRLAVDILQRLGQLPLFALVQAVALFLGDQVIQAALREGREAAGTGHKRAEQRVWR